MSIGNRPVWRIPKRLTVGAVEQLATVGRDAPEVEIHLSGDGTSADPLASAKLQATLGQLQRNSTACKLTVPPNTLAGERAERAFAEPGHSAGPVTPAEKCLASSLEGLVLGQLCELEPTGQLDSSALRILQMNELRKRKFSYGRGRSQTIAIPTSADAGDRSRTRERVNRIDTRIADIFSHVQNRRSDISERWWFEFVSNFAFEATENTYRHGRFDLEGDLIPSVRLLTVMRHNVDELSKRTSANQSNRQMVGIGQYLDRLRRHYSMQKRNLPAAKLVEMTVSDGGLGIAARMAGTCSIYHEADLGSEVKFLQAALEPGGTSRSSADIGAGQGTKKMLRQCHRLRGMFTLSTGRLEISRTFLDEDGRPGHHDFENTQDSAFDVEPFMTQTSLSAGASWTLIFPVDDDLVS